MTTSTWHLKPEHQVLGAHLDEEHEFVISYSDPNHELEALQNTQAVVDLHGMRMLLVSGAQAEYFIECSCATQALFVGQNAFSAIFDGEGRLLGCPLIMRTGDHEYLIFDKDVQFENIQDWMLALSQAQQNGQQLFQGVNVEEKTGALYPIALAGPGAKVILNDYLSDSEALSYPGMTTAIRLDQIDTISSSLPLEYPAYLLLVPPTMARTLFRSFLSFKELETAGFTSFWKCLTQDECSFLKLFETAESSDGCGVFDLNEFIERGLVRKSPNYIGARAILGQ